MIDIEKAKVSFYQYIAKYDDKNKRIDSKVDHIYSVLKVCNYLCSDLNLSEEDKKLAELIALLHDIGRFEQLKRYNTFADHESIDHADFGVHLLFEENLIREFIEDSQYDSIIYQAIQWHNKYKIGDGLSERELLHAKLIRDTDKTDNFIRFAYRQNLEVMFGKPLLEVGKESISDKVYEDFCQKKCIVSSDRKSNMDWWVSLFAFLFDYNFASGLKFIQENDFLNQMYARIPYSNPETMQRMTVVQRIANEYLNQKVSIK